MKQVFGYDSTLMRLLTKLGDCICASILWLIFSLPIVTIGVSSAALYAAVYRCIRKDGSGLWRTFWDAFRENAKRSTLAWLPALALMALLTVDVFVFRSIKLVGGAFGNLYWVALVLWCAALTWIIYLSAYAARFNGSVREILRFSFLMLILHPIMAVGVLVPVVAGLALILYVPYMIFAAPAAILWISSVTLEKVFLLHMRPEDVEKTTSVPQDAWADAETEEDTDDE